jgi:hypothetical protein
MARIIDLGLKKADDPIFTEGIRFISIRKPKPQPETVTLGLRSLAQRRPNDPVTTPTPTKETPHEHQK